MRPRDGQTTPIWEAFATAPQRPALGASTSADVCVVGAGIAGMTTAYLLARDRKSVVVLDEGPIGGGQTGRTSAHLTCAIDDRFSQIEGALGEEASRLCYQSHAAAIDKIEAIAAQEGIECDFARLDGLLFARQDESPDVLVNEHGAAHRAGVAGVELIDRQLFAGAQKAQCLRFPNQARFHPLKYLYGLASAFESLGGRIFTGCRVRDVRGASPKKGQPARAQIDDGPLAVEAQAMVVATNTPAPINDWMGIYTKQASYRTYMIVAPVPTGSVEDALYWDTGHPYHYVRLLGDKLLIGGEDHKVGQLRDAEAPFARLEQWARQHLPMIGPVSGRWSGQVQEPADGVAFIGRALTADEGVYVATGDSGQGLTHGTIAAMLITDLILGRVNPWEKLYDPGRKQINLEFLRENLNTARQYAALVTPGELKSFEELAPGQGGVMRQGASKIAVFRDDAGALHKCSALCTHLKCVVQWNPIEKSWDCPCHGSRFDPAGKVLMGPAIDDLPAA